MKSHSIYSVFAFCMLLLFAGCSSEVNYSPNEDLLYCQQQINNTIAELKARNDSHYDYLPHCIPNNNKYWRCHRVSNEVWTAGFWPGILWLDYEYQKDEKIKEEAEKYTEALRPLANSIQVYDHNIGIEFMTSFGNAYRITQDEKYKHALFDAAQNMASLFNAKTSCMMSSPHESMTNNWQLSTTIGNLVSMELFFWVSKHGGSSRFYDMAISHGLKTAENAFYDDNTVSQIAVYDTLTGAFMERATIKGYNDQANWSRGQAWAIYGFTMYYRESSRAEFLAAAQRAADGYLQYLPKNDYVPYWGLNLPVALQTQKDASAAAIAADALLELANYVPEEKGLEYRNAAKNMLISLAEKYHCDDCNAFIKHCTGNWPLGFEIDASLIYADYFYIEALLRLTSTK